MNPYEAPNKEMTFVEFSHSFFVFFYHHHHAEGDFFYTRTHSRYSDVRGRLRAEEEEENKKYKKGIRYIYSRRRGWEKLRQFSLR